MAILAQITGFITQTVFWVFMLIIIAALLIGAYFLGMMVYRLLRYKIKVLILDHTGTSELARMDLAREVTEKPGNKKYLQLLRMAEKVPLPNPDKYIAMGVRKLLVLHKHNDMLTPMAVTHNSPASFTFNTDDLVSVLFWREQDHQEALDNYRDKAISWWAQHSGFIMSASMILMMFVLFFILIQKIQGGVTVRAVIDTSQLIAASVA